MDVVDALKRFTRQSRRVKVVDIAISGVEEVEEIARKLDVLGKR
jgi:hypothetical protein